MGRSERPTPRKEERVWVMVLGDAGRSPRMQYHTSSLCKTPGFEVHLIGQRGAALIPELEEPQRDGRLTVHYIPETPAWLRRLQPRVLALLLKALLQLAVLLYMALVSLPAPRVILLQLPPALPTMAVCRLAALRHRARLVFDWHNFAYTLMSIGMGRKHPVVRVAEWYERYWAPAADANLCVTRAMAAELQRHWRTTAAVFYDRPPDFFRPASLEEKHDLLLRLQPAFAEGRDDFLADLSPPPPPAPAPRRTPSRSGASKAQVESATAWTVRGADGEVSLRPDRPALVVSSTSWTPDEDFGVLLDAATVYDGVAEASPGEFPRVVVLVTGRGPQRAEYEARIAGLGLRHVAFRTLWLEPGDYPRLLGSADLGVSLHASSSGLDLPMKVVDMFGCGLPVAALAYPCLGELVADRRNGLLFADAQGLAAHLLQVFRGPFPRSDRSTLLSTMRACVAGSGMQRWHEAWKEVVLPLLA